MRKVICLILALTLTLVLTACGKSEAVKNVEALISSIGAVSLDSKTAIESAQEAFDALPETEKSEVENYYLLVESQKTLSELEANQAQQIVEELKAAWAIVDHIGSGLYHVWHGWVWEKDEMIAQGLQFYANKASLSLDEIIEGFAARNYVNEMYAKTGVNWNSISEADKERYRKATIELFEKAKKAQQYADMTDVLSGTVNAFKLNGYLHKAQTLLEDAKQGLKELPTEYEYYDALKDLYTTTSALADFCASPSGSLTQFSNLLNDYRKAARDNLNELDFAFE